MNYPHHRNAILYISKIMFRLVALMMFKYPDTFLFDDFDYTTWAQGMQSCESKCIEIFTVDGCVISHTVITLRINILIFLPISWDNVLNEQVVYKT